MAYDNHDEMPLYAIHGSKFFALQPSKIKQGNRRLRYVLGVDPEDFFAVIDAQIVGLERHNELPDDFLRAIPRQLDTVIETAALAIGGWENSSDGPLVLALASTGQIVSVVAVNPAQLPALGDTLASIEYWLSSMTLPNLSELSGNSIEFYEGLLELSPQSSVVLAPRRRFLLLTAVADLDLTAVQARVPDADIEVLYLDVLQAPGGPAIVRRRESVVVDPAPFVEVQHTLPVQESATNNVFVTEDEPAIPSFAEIPEVAVAPVVTPDEAAALQPATNEFDFPANISIPPPPAPDLTPADYQPEVVSQSPDEFSIAPDSAGLVDLTEQPPTIDLDQMADQAAPAPMLALPPVEAGRTYDLDLLPLLFDATGSTLESISNELFAVNDAIVIVASLPERRRDTPFEDRRRFRWDTSLERIQLLNEHGFDIAGTRRTVHLFVESDRQPGYAAYVGELSRTAFQTQTQVDGETAWFSISPSLDSDLYRMLRKGRLPSHDRTLAV